MIVPAYNEAVGIERTEMRRGIDAARHPADDGDLSVRQVAAQPARHFERVRRRRARSYDSHHRAAQAVRLSLRPKNWWWIGDGCERRGIAGVAERNGRDGVRVHRATLFRNSPAPDLIIIVTPLSPLPCYSGVSLCASTC